MGKKRIKTPIKFYYIQEVATRYHFVHTPGRQLKYGDFTRYGLPKMYTSERGA